MHTCQVHFLARSDLRRDRIPPRLSICDPVKLSTTKRVVLRRFGLFFRARTGRRNAVLSCPSHPTHHNPSFCRQELNRWKASHAPDPRRRGAAAVKMFCSAPASIKAFMMSIWGPDGRCAYEMKIRPCAHLNQKLDQFHVARFLGRRLEVSDSQSEQSLAVAGIDQAPVLLDRSEIALFYEIPKTWSFSGTCLAARRCVTACASAC